MPILLYRVDERLIHGQVVIGWGQELRPDRYIVVDDELAAGDWEQDLFRLGAGDIPVVFATAAEAREALPEWRAAPERSILLLRSIATLARFAEGGGLAGERVNLGLIHPAPGREEVLTYLYLSPEDRASLRELADGGVTVTAQDLPDAHRVNLRGLV